jgi:hypothetical protein
MSTRQLGWGHGTLGLQVPGINALAGTRDSRWEDHDFDRAASAAVGTRATPTDLHGLTSSSAAFAIPVSFPRWWSRRREPSTFGIDLSRLTIMPRTRTLSAARAGRMFAINWNVTAPDAPTVAMTDLSLIAFPYPNELGK